MGDRVPDPAVTHEHAWSICSSPFDSPFANPFLMVCDECGATSEHPSAVWPPKVEQR